MEEQANAVLTGEELLAMRETAKQIPVIDEVFEYAMKLVTATHPEVEGASDFTKKYIRFGASPRAGQALITAGKVRALMAGRLNVSYEDIDALAYPILRHRVKPSFNAITEKMTTDELIGQLLVELKGHRK
jgi:MoxR-like ATPase